MRKLLKTIGEAKNEDLKTAKMEELQQIITYCTTYVQVGILL